ncbi:hypothetical protein ACQKNC_12670 [Lysinibacillus sp. NPDC094177]|uniref:hypothetical protein n=1 Tax=Lysinibacillus sp. NPDC094177 TaxID=3390580 RepID=UPI003D06B458
MFGETEVFEILESNKSNLIAEDLSRNFPITLWTRIEYKNDSINRVEISDQEIISVPSLLISKGFDTSTPYIF